MKKQNTPNKKRVDKIQRLKKMDNFCELILDFITIKPMKLIDKIFSKFENLISIILITVSFSMVLLGITTIIFSIMGYISIKIFESIFCLTMGILMSIMSIKFRLSILIEKES